MVLILTGLPEAWDMGHKLSMLVIFLRKITWLRKNVHYKAYLKTLFLYGKKNIKKK